MRYRRSVLGIAWSLLNPIAMTIVLCTFFSQLMNIDVKEYGTYLLAGLSYWTFIATCVHGGCSCLYAGEMYIRQYPTPLAIYPLRIVLGAAFHFCLASRWSSWWRGF